MTHDGCMIREVSELVWFDPELLHALVSVGGVVLVNAHGQFFLSGSA